MDKCDFSLASSYGYFCPKFNWIECVQCIWANLTYLLSGLPVMMTAACLHSARRTLFSFLASHSLFSKNICLWRLVRVYSHIDSYWCFNIYGKVQLIVLVPCWYVCAWQVKKFVHFLLIVALSFFHYRDVKMLDGPLFVFMREPELRQISR